MVWFLGTVQKKHLFLYISNKSQIFIRFVRNPNIALLIQAVSNCFQPSSATPLACKKLLHRNVPVRCDNSFDFVLINLIWRTALARAFSKIIQNQHDIYISVCFRFSSWMEVCKFQPLNVVPNPLEGVSFLFREIAGWLINRRSTTLWIPFLKDSCALVEWSWC